MKNIIGVLLIALGIIGGLYVGLWLLFIQPIMVACVAYDMGTLTATIIGTTIIKCILASVVGSVFAWCGVCKWWSVIKILNL